MPLQHCSKSADIAQGKSRANIEQKDKIVQNNTNKPCSSHTLSNLMPKPLTTNHYNVFTTDNPRNKCLLNSSVYRENEIWQTPHSEIKHCASLHLFKDKIKTWRCDRWQCQICSRYIANIGCF